MITEQIENFLRDYHWMVREIVRLQRNLYGGISSSKSWGLIKNDCAI